MTTEQPLAGKVALVTGGSRGLGLAIADGLAGAGADLVIASRKPAPLAAAAAQLRDRHEREVVDVPCNVSDWSQCDALVEAAYARFGAVDVLVNDAGMSPVYERLSDITQALFAKVIDTNLSGAFRLCALVGERMSTGAGGSIVNVSSIAAIRPTPDVIPYAAAKAGVNAMTEGLARAFGPTVRVNCIQAGPFLTDIAKHWDMDAFEEFAASTLALRRGGEPHEIVGAALYFATDASSFCTGSILRVDGGRA